MVSTKKKVRTQNREEEKEEMWNFPVMKGQYRISPLVSASISCIGFVKGQYRIFPLVSAGISRIFPLFLFIWIFRTRSDQIFLLVRLCHSPASISPAMQNQFSFSLYNMRHTNRTWTSHTQS